MEAALGIIFRYNIAQIKKRKVHLFCVLSKSEKSFPRNFPRFLISDWSELGHVSFPKQLLARKIRMS